MNAIAPTPVMRQKKRYDATVGLSMVPRPRSRLIKRLVQSSTRSPFHDPPRAGLVRILSVVLAFLLAGCFAEEPVKEEDDVWQPCPQWIAGDGPHATLSFNHTMDGYPLDLLVMQITANGSVHLEAYNDQGRRLGLVVAGDANPSLRLEGGTTEVWVYLSPVEHGHSAPGNVTLQNQGPGTYSVVATPWYKVCGL